MLLIVITEYFCLLPMSLCHIVYVNGNCNTNIYLMLSCYHHILAKDLDKVSPMKLPVQSNAQQFYSLFCSNLIFLTFKHNWKFHSIGKRHYHGFSLIQRHVFNYCFILFRSFQQVGPNFCWIQAYWYHQRIKTNTV